MGRQCLSLCGGGGGGVALSQGGGWRRSVFRDLGLGFRVLGF